MLRSLYALLLLLVNLDPFDLLRELVYIISSFTCTIAYLNSLLLMIFTSVPTTTTTPTSCTIAYTAIHYSIIGTCTFSITSTYTQSRTTTSSTSYS